MPGNIASLTPAAIASWPTPNYVNPPERSWLPAASGILYGITTITIGLRFWVRSRKQAGGLGIDDLMLGLAWLASTMYTIVAIINAVDYHMGRHAWDIPIPYFEKIALMAWLGELSFLWTGCCTKISVLLFYRRIVAGTYDRRWKWAILTAIVFTGSWTVALMFTLVFNCIPTDAYWKSFNPLYTQEYTCVNTIAVNLMAGIFAMSSDLYAVILPCVMIRNLQISRQHKLALNILFGLGLFIVAISGVRTYYMWRIGHDSDVSWNIFNIFFWGELELQLSIILASLPALRAFFRKYIVSTFVHSSATGHSSHRSFAQSGFRRPDSYLEQGPVQVAKNFELDVYDCKPLAPRSESAASEGEDRRNGTPASTLPDVDFESGREKGFTVYGSQHQGALPE